MCDIMRCIAWWEKVDEKRVKLFFYLFSICREFFSCCSRLYVRVHHQSQTMNADYENFFHNIITISQDFSQNAKNDRENVAKIIYFKKIQKSIFSSFWRLLSNKSSRRVIKSFFNTFNLIRDNNFVIFTLKIEHEFQKWFVKNTSWK